VQVGSTLAGVVLGSFDGLDERAFASGDESEDLGRVGSEGGWALDRVEKPDPAAGAGAEVDQAPTALPSSHDEVDRPPDVGQRLRNGQGDALVLGVHRDQ